MVLASRVSRGRLDTRTIQTHTWGYLIKGEFSKNNNILIRDEIVCIKLNDIPKTLHEDIMPLLNKFILVYCCSLNVCWYIHT